MAITIIWVSVIKWKKYNNIAQYISLTSIKKIMCKPQQFLSSQTEIEDNFKNWLFGVFLWPASWILWLYSKNLCYNCRFQNKFFDFFWNMFYIKTVKISNIIIQCIQRNPMSSNFKVLIAIYYIWPILYFIREITSRIN